MTSISTRRWPARHLKRGTTALLVLASIASPALARPDLSKMTCAAAQQMVQRNGKVVFTTSPTTYALFVSNRSYCDRWEDIYPQYARTKDTPNCPVAYKCQEPLFRRSLWDR